MTIALNSATSAGTTTGYGRGGSGTFTVTLSSYSARMLGIIPCYLDGNYTCTINESWSNISGSPFGSTNKLYIFYKILGASETNPTITVTSTGTLASGAACMVFSGVDPDNPVDVVGSASTGTGTPMTAGAITTVRPNAWALGVCGRGDNEASSGQSFGGSTSGVTERLDAGSSGGDDSQVSAYSKEIATPGSTGSGSATTSATDPWVSVIISLNANVNPSVADAYKQSESIALDVTAQPAIAISAAADSYRHSESVELAFPSAAVSISTPVDGYRHSEVLFIGMPAADDYRVAEDLGRRTTEGGDYRKLESEVADLDINVADCCGQDEQLGG